MIRDRADSSAFFVLQRLVAIAAAIILLAPTPARAETGTELLSVPCHTPLDLKFSASGNELFVGYSRSVCLGEVGRHPAQFHLLSWPGGDLISSASLENTSFPIFLGHDKDENLLVHNAPSAIVQLWTPDARTLIREIDFTELPLPQPFQFGRGKVLKLNDTQLIVASWSDYTSTTGLSVVDFEQVQVLSTATAMASSVDMQILSPTEVVLTYGNTPDDAEQSSATIAVFNTSSSEILRVFQSANRRLVWQALSPDSRWFAGSPGDRLIIIETAAWQMKYLATTGRRVSRLAFSPDGEILAIADLAGSIALLRPEAPPLSSLQWQKITDQRITAIAFSPDETQLIIGTREGQIVAHDLSAWPQ